MNRLYVFTALLMASGLFLAGCSSTLFSSTEETWEVWWEDRFEGPGLNSAHWTPAERGGADWNNTMDPDCEECLEVRDGMLVLHGIINNDTLSDPSPYLTGGVRSRGKVAAQYGWFEVRARLQSATGAWPAIWLMADEDRLGAYPRNGEIDIMERLNYNDYVYHVVHSYYTLHMDGRNHPPNYTTTPVNPEEFNTYGVKHYPDRLVYTVNGQETFTYPKLADGPPEQWPFDQPYYFILSMQLGGNWVGEVDPDDLPVKMEIDWVRISKLSGSHTR